MPAFFSRRVPAVPQLRSGGAACAIVALMGVSLATVGGHAATLSPAELKRMSLEELLQQEVVLVSRRPESLSKAASGIQVISSEAIRRSGATRLPEALRLASNLHVAQVDSSRWAVSARGFNSILANKLLVMIDGRTVYSPLFAGVFWDSQDVMLEDVDRIEVVSGPGAALWGANAVNGVINVSTKRAWETQGLLVTGGGGSGLRRFASIRYGGVLGPNVHYRVYGKFALRDANIPPAGGAAQDDWRRTQGGFLVNWEPTNGNLLTFQGDLSENRTPGSTADFITRGRYLQGRWSRVLSADSELQVQLYYDRDHRNLPGSYNDRLDTYDLDFQHRFVIGVSHQLAWGAGYRRIEDDFKPARIIMVPQRRSLERLSAFLQDNITLIPDRLHLTLGTKVEDNSYTGTELQPSVRFSWKQNDRQTYWAAVSRAVRTPSRLDRDRFFPGVSAGSPNFDSEVLLAWEAGSRVQPHERLSLGVAPFYHDYDRIRSIEPARPGAPLPREIGNGQKGRSYGVEVTADFQVTDWWQIHAGITELRVNIEPKPGSADTSYGILEAVDAKRFASLRSVWNLPGNLELWSHLRHAGRLTNRAADVPGFVELDARIAWRPSPGWEVSIAGRNLLDDQHPEYGDATLQFEVERSIYAMLQWNY